MKDCPPAAISGAQRPCRNCRIPLGRQQRNRVLGLLDRAAFDPTRAPNLDFDPSRQSEDVTCAAGHLRNSRILGPYGDVTAPHAVERISGTNQICVRCHVVSGQRWDTFRRFPPRGTAAKIVQNKGRCGRIAAANTRLATREISAACEATFRSSREAKCGWVAATSGAAVTILR